MGRTIEPQLLIAAFLGEYKGVAISSSFFLVYIEFSDSALTAK